VWQSWLDVLSYPPEYSPVLRLVLRRTNHCHSIWQSWLFIFRRKLPRRLDVDRTDFFPPNFVSARNSELQLEGMGNLITKSLIGLSRTLCFFESQREWSCHTNRVSLFAVLHESGNIHGRADVRIDRTFERIAIKGTTKSQQLSWCLVGGFIDAWV
jgi:hypothetical protein